MLPKHLLKVEKTKTILATGAHFDDVEVGVGGTLSKHLESGDEIYLAIFNSDEFRTGDPTIRYEEQLCAMEVLGLESDRLILFSSGDTVDGIIAVLDEVNPDIIYAPYEQDTHQDHVQCSKVSQAVGRKRNITTIFYYCGSSVEFTPNLFSFIDFNKKMESINCYKTQIACGALKLNIQKKIESYWASLVSIEDDSYAEGLIIRKMIYEV
jgi:LmbE family N-acetylglucosaminyl deacetylase